MSTYARLYKAGKTYNIGTFSTEKEAEAAKKGAEALFNRLQSKKTEKKARKGASTVEVVEALIEAGKFDEVLDRLMLAMTKRKNMLGHLPKQDDWSRPPANHLAARQEGRHGWTKNT